MWDVGGVCVAVLVNSSNEPVGWRAPPAIRKGSACLTLHRGTPKQVTTLLQHVQWMSLDNVM